MAISEIAGLLSLMAAIAGLSVTSFIFYRVREDIKDITNQKREIDEIKQRLERDTTVSNELVTVLYDLHRICSSYKAYIDLSQAKIKVHDTFFDELDADFATTEKHFAELALFSSDPERRKSVARSLAHSVGDINTYTLFTDLERGEFGEARRELGEYRKALAKRLGGMTGMTNITTFDIRSDGGAF